jgi:multidrug efflux pump subunit AcrA (membrane-fusion protein)
MIPLAAVAIKDDQSVVQALDGSKIRFTKVEVAEETANYARVIDGLKSGMTVVAIFDDELEDNQQVTVK